MWGLLGFPDPREDLDSRSPNLGPYTTRGLLGFRGCLRLRAQWGFKVEGLGFRDLGLGDLGLRVFWGVGNEGLVFKMRAYESFTRLRGFRV